MYLGPVQSRVVQRWALGEKLDLRIGSVRRAVRKLMAKGMDLSRPPTVQEMLGAVIREELEPSPQFHGKTDPIWAHVAEHLKP